jgi:hypothetical protein
MSKIDCGNWMMKACPVLLLSAISAIALSAQTMANAPAVTFTTLRSFDGTDGARSNGLVQATNGKFYGTTGYGGVSNASSGGCGTVFGLSVGLGSFVATNPTSGKVGKAIKILGNNLTGATSVTFNGTAATFTVKSKSEITTTVPFGATTGKVKVTFPHGTRSSNVPFQVVTPV